MHTSVCCTKARKLSGVMKIIKAVAAFLVLASFLGCDCGPKSQSQMEWHEVDCSECQGKGFVEYEADHEFCKLGLAVPNTKYKCSMCSGDKKVMSSARRK